MTVAGDLRDSMTLQSVQGPYIKVDPDMICYIAKLKLRLPLNAAKSKSMVYGPTCGVHLLRKVVVIVLSDLNS